MNNEKQSEQQKAVRRFLLGVFLLHQYVPLLLTFFVGDIFFLAFMISLIPGGITSLIFYRTQVKANRRYLLLAFLMPFLISLIVGVGFSSDLYLDSVDLNWYHSIETIIDIYVSLSIPCTILALAQLVLVVVCLPEMHK